MAGKIRSFTELNVWQEAHKLAIAIFHATKLFPKEELFVLTSQIRRAALSITSNIAEGFSRKTKKDKAHFYTVAHGSLTELQNQLLFARDIGYLSNEQFQEIANQTVRVAKLLNGSLRSLNG